jgi:hypothetical protein
MSWHVSFIGTPERVVKALEDNSQRLDGQSKLEYDSASPHLVGIVRENFGEEGVLLKVTASGSGYSVNGDQKSRSCVTSIERIYGLLV